MMLICIYLELVGVAAIIQLRGRQRDTSARHHIPCLILDSTNEQLKATKEKLRNQTEDIVQLWDNFDNLEQYTRKNSIEIQGIPEDAYSSTEDVVIKVAEALNITVEPEDIEIFHKLKRGKGIIAKFVSHKTKSIAFTRNVHS